MLGFLIFIMKVMHVHCEKFKEYKKSIKTVTINFVCYMGHLVSCESLNFRSNIYQMDKRPLERRDSKLLCQACH